MTKLDFIDKINDILIGLNTAESDALGSLYDELMRSQWIPVEERLPEKEEDNPSLSVNVIVTDGFSRFESYYNFNLHVWVGAHLYGNITHWMPLPEAPRKEVSHDLQDMQVG